MEAQKELVVRLEHDAKDKKAAEERAEQLQKSEGARAVRFDRLAKEVR